jgi:TRAP-type C4-dicarboxylate transport system permease small subunit
MADPADPHAPGGRWAAVIDGITAFGLFAMMMVTVVDVIGRYLFRAPLPAGFELTEYLMGVLVFLALPVVSLRGEHVSITLIDGLLGPRATRIRDRVLGVLAGVVCAGVAWAVFGLASRMAAYGDGTQTLGLPLAPLAMLVTASLVVCGAILAITPFRHR